jgi:ABC-type phosphate/phosphonate transport system permease subunit
VTDTGLSTNRRWLPWLALILAIALLSWLPVEDVSVRNATLFAALISSWFAIRFLLPIHPSERYFYLRHLMVGSVAGLAVAPLALFLIALKTGLHSHSAADFYVEQLLTLLYQTHIWVMVGLLIGLSFALLRMARAR